MLTDISRGLKFMCMDLYACFALPFQKEKKKKKAHAAAHLLLQGRWDTHQQTDLTTITLKVLSNNWIFGSHWGFFFFFLRIFALFWILVLFFSTRTFLFYWSIVALHCSVLCYKTKWSSHTYSHIPSFFGFPSHLGHDRELTRDPCVIY